MKKALCAVVLALALPAALLAYENSPADSLVLPEATWALATGGGTWVTEIQITDRTGGSIVDAYYFPNGAGGSYRSVTLWTSPGYECSGKWTNVLATMQGLDGSFTYYNTSGSIWLFANPTGKRISAIARLSNGNYGKTFPGLQWVDANSANVGRNMRIMNVMFSSLYRTFAGFSNFTSGGYSMVCRFYIIGSGWVYYGSYWEETFAAWEFKAFNIFTKAGITSGTYTNNWLWVVPQSCGNTAADSKGLFCYGSIANNTTNDTYSIIAVQWN